MTLTGLVMELRCFLVLETEVRNLVSSLQPGIGLAISPLPKPYLRSSLRPRTLFCSVDADSTADKHPIAVF